MLQIANPAPECKLSGRELDRQLDRKVRGSNATQRALLANDLQTGRVVVDRLTARQARLLTGCSFGYQNAVAHLSAFQMAWLRSGRTTMAEVVKRPSEAAIERFLERDFEGVYRVFQRMLEARTQPAAVGEAVVKNIISAE
jgi:hypothetical protein